MNSSPDEHPSSDFDPQLISDVDSSNPFTNSLTPELAFKFEQFNEASRVNLADIPSDSIIELTTLSGNLTFYKRALMNDEHIDDEYWTLHTKDDENKDIEMTYKMIGACIGDNGNFAESYEQGPTFRKNYNFLVRQVIEFYDGAEKSVPFPYSIQPNVNQLNESELQENRDLGGLVSDSSGKPMWRYLKEETIHDIRKITVSAIEISATLAEELEAFNKD